ncbi:MAG: GntR family transcriptional regulator [Polynucleobacter sp.]|nr:GntR family transcriptional regulator [Polynucleobacter sp.]MDZ4057486.1 GntR family transcriptional regulator [Polynucleobacter sp.]
MTEKLPLYQTLANTIAERIREGQWAVGSTLPSETQLCKLFKASRHTLRHALSNVERDGLILRHQGAATQVISRQSPRRFTQSFNSPADILRYPRDTYRINSIEEYVECDEHLARILDAPVGSSWYHIGGVRKHQGSNHIIAWTDIYILPQFAELTSDPEHAQIMVFEQIERRFAIKIDRAEVDVYATKADKLVAKRLSIEEGSACLVIIRRYFDANGTLFEATVTHHPEGRYTYSMELRSTRAN